MKQRLEKFLAGHLYIFLVAVLSFFIWTYKFFVPDDLIMTATFGSMMVLAILFFLVLFFYENSIYSLPIILTALFTIGIYKLNIESIGPAILGFMVAVIFFVSFIVHIIKYKVKLKLNALGLSLVLVAISFLIPLIYRPFTQSAFILSIMGVVYLFIYLFYSNTIKGNQMNYMFRNLAMIGLMLSFQLVAMFVNNLITNPNLQNVNLYQHFLDIFPVNDVDLPGWGNVNDLTIHIVLSCAAVFYYLRKYPKNLIPWFALGWVGIWIMLSFSKGSMATIVVVALGAVVYAIFKRNKRQIINLGFIILLGVILILLNIPLITQIIENYKSSVDAGPEAFLTGRLRLWWDDPQSAVSLFREYPLFGYGWDTPLFILAPAQNRVTIYHSTFFHVLATGGIFGIAALIFHFVQIGLLFKRKPMDVAKYALLFTYLVTQAHGMVDNTQWMVHYTIVTLLVFSVLDVAYLASKPAEVTYAQPVLSELGLAHSKTD